MWCLFRYPVFMFHEVLQMVYSEKWKKFHIASLCVFILTDIIFFLTLVFSMSSSTVAGADAFAVGMFTAFICVVWVYMLILEAVIFFCGRYLLRDQKCAFDLE